MQLTERAPAKINLFLHVCGKRADGYHLLDSLVVFTAFGDELTATPAETVDLAIAGPFAAGLSAGDDNLVIKAARFLAGKLARRDGVRFTLDKRLPVASGIGGGSADAAAALRAAARIWRAELADISGAELAAALGADVPVCLALRPMRMQGIGEILQPACPMPAAWLVLVNPQQPLATAPVFKALAGRHSGPTPELPAGFADARALAQFLGRTVNDLAAPATEIMPTIRDMLGALASTEACLHAQMSGSGPTCFGLFGDENAARRAEERLRGAHRDWWIVATPLLAAG